MTQKLLAVIVLVMVASLSVAGCTTTNNANQTPSATSTAATQHDAFLEKYLAVYKNLHYSNSIAHVQAWQLDWVNSTSARLQFTELNKTSNLTNTWDQTWMVFPTTQDATNYVNAMNLTAYSLASTEYPSGGAYQNVTGHAPQIYKDYEYSEGSLLNISSIKLHQIVQYDNIVVVSTGKELS